MIWQFHYFVKEAFLGLRENFSAVVITTVTIAFTLMLIGVFLMVYLNLNSLMGSLRQEIKVIAYLKDGLPEKEIADLREQIAKEDGVSGLTFTSKDAALEMFRSSSEGNDFLLKGLGDNPLPASFEITPDKAFQAPETVRRLAERLGKFKGIEEIQYGREWVENVDALMEVLKVAGALGGMILGLATVVITSTTIGLTVWARLAEIEVLKLIGATRMYIQLPFLMEGAMIGLFGGLFSLLILHGIYGLVVPRLIEMSRFLGSGFAISFLPASWALLFVAVGVTLGFAGSLISIRRLL